MVGRRTLTGGSAEEAVTRWRERIAAAPSEREEMRAACDAILAMAAYAAKAGEGALAGELWQAAADALTDVFETFASRLTQPAAARPVTHLRPLPSPGGEVPAHSTQRV